MKTKHKIIYKKMKDKNNNKKYNIQKNDNLSNERGRVCDGAF